MTKIQEVEDLAQAMRHALIQEGATQAITIVRLPGVARPLVGASSVAGSYERIAELMACAAEETRGADFLASRRQAGGPDA